MAAITTASPIYEQDAGLSRPSNSPYDYKEFMVETPDTADATNTVVITLADYGITNIKSIQRFYHSTNHSVVKAGTASTTAVATGVLTITLGSKILNDKYVFVVGGY